MAVDQESGDATFATVVVEVLPEGQTSKVHTTYRKFEPPGPLKGNRTLNQNVFGS